MDAYLERGYYLLEKEGKIVSQAVIGRKLIKGKGISGNVRKLGQISGIKMKNSS